MNTPRRPAVKEYLPYGNKRATVRDYKNRMDRRRVFLMRRILWAIVILSPFFALAQNDRVSPSSIKQFASAVVQTTSNKIADLVVPLING